MSDLFDAGAMYDEDYLYFFAGPTRQARGIGDVADARSDADAALAAALLELRPGARVLDVGCGHGRIANRLAARGAQVVGLDVSTVFLDRARADATTAGVQDRVSYVEGDIRKLPVDGSFDGLVSWSTAFGYFDDVTNREVLRGRREALRPGGHAVLDLNNLSARLRNFRAGGITAVRDERDLLADRARLDPMTSRLEVTRTVVRGGRAREVTFVVRLFAFTELRDWLLDAGFVAVDAVGEDGAPLSAEHQRMVVTASAA